MFKGIEKSSYKWVLDKCQKSLISYETWNEEWVKIYGSYKCLGIQIFGLKFCSKGIQLWFYTAYITERIKLPTFIYLLFRLFTTQAFIRRKDYISEFPYILTTLYEFYMNVDMQVICCTVTSVLSPTSAPSPLHRHLTVAGGKKWQNRTFERSVLGTRKLTDIES